MSAGEPVIVLVLQGRVPEGGQAALEAFLVEARPYYESHDGNRLRLHWDSRDPRRFREIIEYQSQTAFDADDERTRSDPVMRSLLERWRVLLVGPLEVSVWRTAELPER